jgi:2'-hydroxyisoflavone reductase
MPGRVLVIRPGFIVGPYDPTDRFTYWPYRVAQGGDMLAPGQPETFIQHMDARDLAAFTLRAIEQKLLGIFNTVTPIGAHSMQDLLETSRRISGSDARFSWIDEGFLEAHEVLDHLTIWPPTAYANFVHVSSERAVAAGLTFRSLEETVRDTLEWAKTFSSDYQVKAGLTREREKELLELWRERSIQD